jgi:hypothetical protein
MPMEAQVLLAHSKFGLTLESFLPVEKLALDVRSVS